MKMLQPSGHLSLNELTPVAKIHSSVESLLRKGVEFSQDSDEWGDHQIAAFRAPDLPPFAVVRFEHDPIDIAHLFILGDVPGATIADLISQVATALEFPPEAFQWRDTNGELVSLAPERAA